MGPLTGRKIVELAGIGPGPFCAMLLADLGADVIARRPRRRRRPRHRPADRSSTLMRRSRRSIAVDLKQPDGVDAVLRLVDAGRRADRRLPPRRDRAARARPRRLPRAQSAPGLRPHDRLGPGRSAARRRPATTSTTSRSPARSHAIGRDGEPPVAAAQPGRRLRRRRALLSRSASSLRCSSASALGQGPGRRRRHGRTAPRR